MADQESSASDGEGRNVQQRIGPQVAEVQGAPQGAPGAGIDAILQMQEAMARMAEMQAQLMERQLTQPLVVTKAPADPNTTLFKRFKEMDPPTFTGTKGEVDAENWIKRMKQIFKIMGASDEEKINLATFMLTEKVYYWWETTERTLVGATAACAEAAAAQVTWEQFLAAD